LGFSSTARFNSPIDLLGRATKRLEKILAGPGDLSLTEPLQAAVERLADLLDPDLDGLLEGVGGLVAAVGFQQAERQRDTRPEIAGVQIDGPVVLLDRLLEPVVRLQHFTEPEPDVRVVGADLDRAFVVEYGVVEIAVALVPRGGVHEGLREVVQRGLAFTLGEPRVFFQGLPKEIDGRFELVAIVVIDAGLDVVATHQVPDLL
jgi:hypothetical protein